MSARPLPGAASPKTTAVSGSPTLGELEWMGSVVSLARPLGWRVAHFRPARTVHGWRTAGSYDAAGFPDLVLVHPERRLVLWRELKAEGEPLRPEQKLWRDWLTDAGADWGVWTPRDLPEVAHIITGLEVAR